MGLGMGIVVEWLGDCSNSVAAFVILWYFFSKIRHHEVLLPSWGILHAFLCGRMKCLFLCTECSLLGPVTADASKKGKKNGGDDS